MASAEPERPAGVPEGAVWDPEAGGWEVAPRSAEGVRDGECLVYGPAGALLSRRRFVAGVQEGPFAVYHPDGRLARAGTFVAGRLDGIVAAHLGEGAGALPLRACCVPEAAVRLASRYEDGSLVQEVFYDRAGTPILSDGRPWPPRPAGVDAGAEFDEDRARWVARRPDLHRVWSAEGALTDELELPGGGRRTTRRFDAGGALVEACGFGPDGRRDGPFFRRLAGGEESPYADRRIRAEQGAFAVGQAVGRWVFLDAEGAALRAIDRGDAFADGAEVASPVFADAPPAADGDFGAMAMRLPRQGRVREALAAAARAAARGGDRAALARVLDAYVVPLAPARAAERGEALTQATELTAAAILDALLTGADAAAAFRALGAVLPPAAAAADFVAASLLLAPERRMTHLTRALIRFQRGDEGGARADLEIVDGESPAAADAVRGHLRTALRPFGFPPAAEPLEAEPALRDVPAGLARDLDEVRGAVAVYATRLGRLRAAVQAWIGPRSVPAWLPPDVAALIPGGPVPLRRGPVPASELDGPGAPGIEVDEEIITAGRDVPALLAEAQADWAALAWLCWAVGLDRVERPDAVAERPLFAEAMKRIVTRCWRVLDRLETGGLLARANGVPGFAWEGIDIDQLPQHLARLVAGELLRVRAMFLWLASPDVASPFQLDLREA